MNSQQTIIAHNKYVAATHQSNGKYDFSKVVFFVGNQAIEETLYQFVKENEQLKDAGNDGCIIFSDAKSVFVLKENFNEIFAERYHAFLHGNTTNTVIKHKEISEEIILISSVNSDIYYPFITKFSSYEWNTIEGLLCQKSIKEPKKIHAFYYADKLFFSYHDAVQKLPFINSYNIQNSDELKFYVSAFCDQFKIDRKTIEVIMAGKKDENYDIKVLDNYFVNVTYLEVPKEVAQNPAVLPSILV